MDRKSSLLGTQCGMAPLGQRGGGGGALDRAPGIFKGGLKTYGAEVNRSSFNSKKILLMGGSVHEKKRRGTHGLDGLRPGGLSNIPIAQRFHSPKRRERGG